MFPFEAFEPSNDVTIVLIGERRNDECRVRQAVLSAMK